AVKHSKQEMGGKRRLHKIERCKIWLAPDRALVKPAAIVALGATAARSLLGRSVTIAKLRGQALHLADGTAASSPFTPRSCCASRTTRISSASTRISSPICDRRRGYCGKRWLDPAGRR